MSANWVAFFIGLFGSVHCIGMCGPLALAIPSVREGGWMIVSHKLMYNAGRIITYTFLGLIIGLLGKQLWILGLQRGVSMGSGMLICMVGISRLFNIKAVNGKFLATLFLPFNKLLHWGLKNKAGHFIIGMLNGLLPCGFVYLALVGAINASSSVASAQYMFYFGLGTFPLMLLATISSGFAGPVVRRHINNAIPYVMICLGFWFILRGMNLNIPYLSPASQAFGISTCR